LLLRPKVITLNFSQLLFFVDICCRKKMLPNNKENLLLISKKPASWGTTSLPHRNFDEKKSNVWNQSQYFFLLGREILFLLDVWGAKIGLRFTVPFFLSKFLWGSGAAPRGAGFLLVGNFFQKVFLMSLLTLVTSGTFFGKRGTHKNLLNICLFEG